METRPKDYPKLTDYTPSKFMLPDSHYDKKKVDKAVNFIEQLKHTKGKWAGKRFWLLPWQETIVRDIFGTTKSDGKRQFRTAFVKICKEMGKSELAAAVALYMLYADNEPSAEVYGAASDRQQASIVFDVAKRMTELTPALLKRSKIIAAQKRLVNYTNGGFYQVLSADVANKHGLNISCVVIDECHSFPNRNLYEVLSQDASDAREQPLTFVITTAGNDKHYICYGLHTKAKDILEGRKTDPAFYPVVYGLEEDDDWGDENNWFKVCPSLGYTVALDRMRDVYRNAIENPAEENAFKQLRLNIWVNSAVRWISEHIYARGNKPIDVEALKGRDCYGGLDLGYYSTCFDFSAKG